MAKLVLYILFILTLVIVDVILVSLLFIFRTNAQTCLTTTSPFCPTLVCANGDKPIPVKQ